MSNVTVAILALIVGGLGGYFAHLQKMRQSRKDAQSESRRILENTKKRQAELELEAKRKAVEIEAEANKLRNTAQEELKEQRAKVEMIKEKLEKRDEEITKKKEEADKIREEARNKEEKLKEREVKLAESEGKITSELERVSNLKKEEARDELLVRAEKEFSEDITNRIKKIEMDVKEEADKKARDIIALSIQKYAAEVASEATVTIVELPSDEMKGRIIGRDGRNINAFEQATGVDVIVDDTPGSIVISGFDLVRRYVAKLTLERLISDGRIHPARIETELQKSQKEVNNIIKDFGEKAVYQAGITGLHPNLIKLMGRLRFRTSYGQNVLKHSIEVSFLAAAIASELGADVNVCRKAGFLHDIGKAVDHEIEGGHATIGGDILKKFKIDERVIHAVAAHHEDIPLETIEDIIVQAADAISSARPGARKESLDNYIKRLTELENTATSFEGVERAYAIQAGREIRVIVDPEDVDDLQALRLAKNIADKIEMDLEYPGQIKVTILRETRATEYAK